MNEQTDSGLACLIRSFDKTRETAYAYIEELTKNEKAAPPKGNSDDISDDVFHATVSAAKLRELAHVYNESFFSGKDSDDADCLMASLRTYPKRDFGLYLIDSHAGVETLISGGEHQGLLFSYRFLRLLR